MSFLLDFLLREPGRRSREAPARISEERRRSIASLFQEGVFAQIWITLTGGKFLADLMLFFGATAIHLGLVNAIAFLAAPAQLLGAYLVLWVGSRKRVIVPSVFICRQVWWLVLVLILVPMDPKLKLWAFIGVYCVCHLSGAVAGNAWLSMLGDLVPEQLRGRVVASRNGLLVVVGVAADFLLSQLREWLGPDWRGFYLFVCVFVATVAGLRTVFIFLHQWEPPFTPPKPPGLFSILRTAFSHPGVRLLIWTISLWNFAVGIAVSFWAPHMMTYLDMPFTMILVYTLIITVGIYIMGTTIWGPVIDRAGTLPVIMTCGAIISCLPLLWLFVPPGDLRLLWLDAVLSGIAWSGFNAAIFSLPFQIIPERNRGFYFAVLSGFNGLALGLGALAGGVVAEYLTPMSVQLGKMTYINYHVTFLLSAVLRMAALFALRRVPDVRGRGMTFMLQAVGDGVQKLMTNPRFVLFVPRLSSRKRSRRHAKRAT